jgi:purine-binding chemotaxis protein CheW
METTSTDMRFADNQINLATFEVHGRICALDVSLVKEIVRCQAVTPLPKAPALIEGVIDLRGAVIPVLDLGLALGGEPVDPDEPRARIVIVDSDSLVLGLRVGAAVDVLSLPATALEDPPALAMQAGYDAVRGVVRRDGEAPVMVLSLDHILESVYRSGVSNSRATEPNQDRVSGQGETA